MCIRLVTAAETSPDHEPYDHGRDATTLALIGKVLARGIPLLCICRGFQELNVALGGTLEGEVQRTEGRLDHRAPKVEALDERYGPLHDHRRDAGRPARGDPGQPAASASTRCTARRWPGSPTGWRSKRCAPDGVVEAASVKGAAGFALGVQWHPEYKAAANPDSVKLFEAFGDAARAYAAARSERSARVVAG
jgi:putative glutamine amidotransferase